MRRKEENGFSLLYSSFYSDYLVSLWCLHFIKWPSQAITERVLKILQIKCLDRLTLQMLLLKSLLFHTITTPINQESFQSILLKLMKKFMILKSSRPLKLQLLLQSISIPKLLESRFLLMAVLLLITQPFIHIFMRSMLIRKKILGLSQLEQVLLNQPN